MPSLKTLQIRMQAGESYYVPPPPLPPSGPAHSGPNHGPEPPAHIMHQAASPLPTIPSTVSLPLAGGAPPLAAGPSLVPPSKSLPRSRTSKQNGRTKEPSTLSGFRSLRSLSVLDIDNLDIVPELKDCIMNSSSTLTELQLSLSDHLASQARKPPPDSDVDDSDVDDDFQLTPSHSIANDGSASAKAFRAQEERKVHEALLGRLFGVELPIPLPKVPVIAQSTDDSSKDAPEAAGPQEIKDAHQEFVAALRSVSEQLMTVVHGTSSRSDAHQEILETIEKAARKYVDSAESNNEEAADEGRSNSQGSGPAIPPVEQAGESSNSVQTAGLDASTSTNDTKGKALNEDERALEEIDIEHPVEMDDGNDNDESLDDKKAGVGSNTSPPAINGIRKAAEGVEVPTSAGIHEAAPDEDASEEEVRLLEEVKSLQSNMDGIKDRMLVLRSKGTPNQIAEIEILEEKVRVFESTIIDLSSQLRTLQELRKSTKSNTITNETSSSAGTKGPLRQSVFDYLRETRGFALETLSIYLIPVKASVLSRAIDLGSLKSLTLLNVGNQASIWTLLSKENKVQPLALRNVFTDHVSDALLICLSQLEELHEFLVVEQNAKSKPESTAPRTSNTIDHIRRTVLAKHMGTLKRIMIKDETTTSNWDVNEKTIVHMCTHGRRLEELAIGLNLHAVVSDIFNYYRWKTRDSIEG